MINSRYVVALIAAVGGSVVAHWICNQRVTGSNPVTVILRTSVLWIFFLIFKIKNSRYEMFGTL